jgi:hypothetical protein
MIGLPLNDVTQWPLLMTRAEVATVIRVSPRTLRRLVAEGRFPPPIRGTWARDVVDRYVHGQRREFERQAARRLRMVGE